MKLSAPIFRLKRQARVLARASHAPLHQVLDQVARQEGYRSWSHLAGSHARHSPGRRILAELVPGDLVLLAARPGQGKTLLGLELAAEAARAGRRGFFFSLESHETAVFDRLRALGQDGEAPTGSLVVDTSDDICADYIADRVRDAGSMVVIDYLQILDQRRSTPELAVQLERLTRLARAVPCIIVTLSQVDRAFDLTGRRLPELADVRLPNPVDLSVFTKACFLHQGEVLLETVR